ncbi:MAG: hypothetical protein QM504_03140 [Pseudomonadota bacterium]
MQYTISGREKPNQESIVSYLKRVHKDIPISEVDSVFAFTEPSTLYGGRRFSGPELQSSDIQELYDHSIGYRIPFTNNYVEADEYNRNILFLEKYHRPGNSVILVNDQLSQWIKEDFPEYKIEASIIKNINSHKKIEAALELYDTVVLPTSLNENLEFLDKVEQKDRITLFAFAGCGINCKSKLCYPSISKFNKFTGYTDFECSRTIKEREHRGKVNFDLNVYVSMGFERFKLIEPTASVTIVR